MNTAEEFWANFEKTDGCWVWKGAIRQPGGYGDVTWKGEHTLAHRVAWILTNGPIPDGKQVCHKCDNEPCGRPDHLFLGTQLDNMLDKVAKGRQARGETHVSRTKPEAVPRGVQHGNAKMTDGLVRELRRLYKAGGVSQPELARRYGLRQSTVNSILLCKTWRHVKS